MLMKHLAGLLLFLSSVIGLCAQTNEAWEAYLAYHETTRNVPAGERIYSLFQGNLLALDAETYEVQLLDRTTGLSDVQIAAIAYSHTEKKLVVAYQNGNIDLMDDGGNVANIPQLKNNHPNIVINSLKVDGGDAYIGTDQGVAHINIAKEELRSYYTLNTNVSCAVGYAGNLFAVTSDGLITCAFTDNPFDPSAWKNMLTLPVRDLGVFAGSLYYTLGAGTPNVGAEWGLWRATKGENNEFSATQITWEPYETIEPGRRYATFTGSGKVAGITADNPGTLLYATSIPEGGRCITQADNGTLWSSNGTAGLQAYKLSNSTLAPTGSPIGGYGPRHDLCYYMRYVDDRLLLAGGRLDPYGRLHYEPMLAIYEDNTWKHFDADEAVKAGCLYRDLTCIIQDPNDENHHYATAAGGGLYEFRNLKFVKHYGPDNSPLRSAAADGSPRYVRTDGLIYDAAGNLWVVNNGVENILNVLKPDAKWQSVYVSGIDGAPFCEKTLFDRNGNLWVASRRTESNHTAGLLRLDYNGTLATSDDVATYRTKINNQDGVTYDLYGGVYAMVEDIDGSIWIGTGTGLFVITDPDGWAKSPQITQIKVPRNDGTNYADYLLTNVAISAIAIDGGNRKWIGTQYSGLYLVSPDGTEVLAHYTTDNSPLLSNYIYSIAPELHTGRIMIGTEKGLCALMSDATAGAETLDGNNISVYPNPVRPEHQSYVTISGLTTDADIKISNAAGHVVAAGTATGGSFRWDLRGNDGQRVPTGVYFVMAATADSKKGATARLVII